MTDPTATSWWRPMGSDAMVTLALPETTSDDKTCPRRDGPGARGCPPRGSSADLRDRQRELAFDMYAEALVRIADEDDAKHRQDRRATA